MKIIKKTRILILHGWQGSSYPHWQSHLQKRLLDNEYKVSFPILPQKNNPNLYDWLMALDFQMQTFKPHRVVCHSLANILWFTYVNSGKMKYNLEKLMLVSPVSPTCTIREISTFFPYSVPLDLKSNITIMASSDNDEFMTIDELYNLSNILKISLKILEGAGHINTKSGFGELPCAYDWITS
jgi:predicted alpha/beta hydrolase family esterase